MSDVPEYALIRFRNGSARPRVTATYRLATGWEKPARKPRFTHELAARLFDDGVTLVRLRWRRQNHQLPVAAHSLSRDPG
jgi:hypothetical protein